MYDLIIENGTVVTPGGVRPASVAVQGEQIARVGDLGPERQDAKRLIDATGRLVIPGGVDPHCHWNLPFSGACSEPADYSNQLAFGGTTTAVDFVFHFLKTNPHMSLHEAIAEKRQESDGLMAVDYGLHVGICGDAPFEVIDEIGDVIRAGMPTIKTLTTYEGFMLDEGHRWGVISEVGKHGGMSVVHAEDDSIANWLTAKYVREGKTHGAYISQTRNAVVEEAAVRRTMFLCEAAGSPLYVLHMYAASAVRTLAEARAKGLPFYGETLSLYLSFNETKLWEENGLRYNNYPTLKTPEDQAALWESLADGSLQGVGSDNCSMTLAQRDAMGSTIEALQAGAPTGELRLPVVFHQGVSEGRLSLERFVDVISTGPARILGLYPRKGQIAEGSDADIVIIDPNERWTVRVEDLHGASDYSPWEGWELQGRVRTTILRGQILVDELNYVGERAAGKFVERQLLREVVQPRALVSA